MGLSQLNLSKKLILNFNVLLTCKYGLWVLFPTNNIFSLFKMFLKNNKLSIKCSKLQVFCTKKFLWLTKGGLFYLGIKNKKDFFLILSFFLKDLFFKKSKQNKLINLKSLSDFMILMNGFLVSIKIYNFIFKCNFEFFTFFKEFFVETTNVSLYYTFFFLKMTVVVLYSIMLIISKVCFLFWMIFFRLVRLFSCFFFFYAYKKSIRS